MPATSSPEDEVCRIAAAHELLVIEDCAHVHGTEWDGHKFPVADMGTFRFQQGNTLAAGFIILNYNETFAEQYLPYLSEETTEQAARPAWAQ